MKSRSCYSCPGSGVPRKGGPTVATLYLSPTPLYYIVLPLNFSAINPIHAKNEMNVAAKIHLGIPRLVWSPLRHFFLQINATRRRNKCHKMMLHIIEITFTLILTSKGFTDKKPWAQYRSSNKYFNISNSDVM